MRYKSGAIVINPEDDKYLQLIKIGVKELHKKQKEDEEYMEKLNRRRKALYG